MCLPACFWQYDESTKGKDSRSLMTPQGLRYFAVFLRIVGGASLLAIFAVLMPYDSMNATHQWLGMGTLPDAPVVGYLARSTSFFYAMFGGLAWVLSFDLPRHRAVVCYLGFALIALGVTLLAVDIVEGMPLYWIAVEGPADAFFGAVTLYFGRRL